MHREARWLIINEQGAERVVEFLCKSGADVNAGTAFGNETAIHKAAMDGHHICISHLLAASANIDEVSSDGYSALHEACREGNTDTVRFLLEKGLIFDTIGLARRKSATAEPILGQAPLQTSGPA
jgi:ankyrin repeat protein